MNRFFEIATSGLFQFIGCFLLCYLPFNCAFKICNRYWRHKTIQKIGYPPTHCDADGDFKPEKDDTN